MAVRSASTLEELAPRLDEVRQLHAGLRIARDRKRYRCTRVSQAEIERHEHRLGLELPPEYRCWLQEVGYGAGPGCGLDPPDRLLAFNAAQDDGTEGMIEDLSML